MGTDNYGYSDGGVTPEQWEVEMIQRKQQEEQQIRAFEEDWELKGALNVLCELYLKDKESERWQVISLGNYQYIPQDVIIRSWEIVRKKAGLESR